MRDVNFQSYMRLQGPQLFITEEYVASPPALIIIDSQGVVWTLGMEFGHRLGGHNPRGEYSFEVLCNGNRTGFYASRIERRGGKVRIFTHQGWMRWTGRTFV